MRKNVWLIFLAALALILQSGLAAAVSPPLLLRWDGSDARQPTKLFIRNLGTGGADASLERVPAQRGDSEPLFVAAGQSIEVTVAAASASGPLRGRTRLGDLPEGGARVEVKALQGSARWITTAVEPGGRRVVEMAPPLLAKTGGGTGYFSTTISWYYSGDLY